MIRVVLADDHPIVCGGLKELISMAPDMSVVAQACNGNEVLTSLRTQQFELLLLDMSMPDPSGVDLIVRIRNNGCNVPILILSMHYDPAIVSQAIKAGANGYVDKTSDPEELLKAIRKTANGGKYIDPVMAEHLVFMSLTATEDPPHKQLSSREYEIFRLLVGGNGVNQIAQRLMISNKTVSTHKLHLMEKLRVSSTAELVKYAMQQRLFDE